MVFASSIQCLGLAHFLCRRVHNLILGVVESWALLSVLCVDLIRRLCNISSMSALRTLTSRRALVLLMALLIPDLLFAFLILTCLEPPLRCFLTCGSGGFVHGDAHILFISVFSHYCNYFFGF